MSFESFLADLIGKSQEKKEPTNFDLFRDEVTELAKKYKVAFVMGFHDNNEFGYRAFPEVHDLSIHCELNEANTVIAHTNMLEELVQSCMVRTYRVGLAAHECQCGRPECKANMKMKQWVPEELKTESPKQDTTEPATEDPEPADGEPQRVEKPIYDKDGKQIGDYEVAAGEKLQTELPIIRERTGLVSPYSIASSIVLYLDRSPYQFHGVCDVAFGIGAKFEQMGWPLGELTKKKLVVKEGHGKFARIRLATTKDYAEAEESTVS